MWHGHTFRPLPFDTCYLLTMLHKKMLLPTVLYHVFIDYAPQKMLLPAVLYHVFNSVWWLIEIRVWLCRTCCWSFLPSFTKYTCSTAWLTRHQTRDQRLLRITSWKVNVMVTLVLFHLWRQEVKVVRIDRFQAENQTRRTVYIKQSL
jgi:hypothetical protein